MKIRKRDGREVDFNKSKIETAILKAFKEVDGEVSDYAIEKASNIASYIESENMKHILGIEEIQDMVEKGLMSTKRKDVARAYIAYRDRRTRIRGNTIDKTIQEIVNYDNDYWKTENSNKDAQNVSTQRDYMAGAISTDLTRRLLLSEDIVKAHDEGLIHFHDADYFAQKIHNCCLINLEDMLENGTVINSTLIEKPKSFSTACTITTQIIACVASGQYGGQSINLSALAPFVDITRQKYKKEFNDDIAEKLTLKDVKDGIQTMQYQINTLNTSNGQTPFVTVFMYLNAIKNEQEKKDFALVIEEVLRQRIKGVKNEVGEYITPAFPKLIYVLEEDNIYKDSKYFYLTQLAAECSAKRMVPDYISEKVMKTLKDGDCYSVMGCRSALTVDRFTAAGVGNIANAKNYNENEHKYSGRFNQGVVTINLPDVALSAIAELKIKNINDEDAAASELTDIFDKILNERLELCHKALRTRHERLLGTLSDASPIHWQHGALARLKKGETIDRLLYNGYSTLSLGYAGLWECVYALTGKKLNETGGKEVGLMIMQTLNDACAKWKKDENIDYSLYGTPIESTTYKFAKCLKKRFDIVEGVTDRDYITNSYHVHVTEPIDAFSKLALESEFQALSPGGAVSYIEVPDLKKNLDAVINIIQFIYENIMYAEINTKSDYCMECGFDGEMEIIDNNNKLDWRCPNCGNMDHSKLNVARRTCGYIGVNFWNQGRTSEIHDRVLHL